MVVVKAALCISHGQADVEKGFSTSKHVVNKTVTLKQHKQHTIGNSHCQRCHQQIQGSETNRQSIHGI